MITLALAFAVPVQADIQAPPGSKYTSARKLGRALSNIRLLRARHLPLPYFPRHF